jgi:adenine-specific DNA-methyltransferase
MDKLKMHSPDITQQNIDRLLELFPNCKTEKQHEDGELGAGIDFDLLKQELSKNIVEGPQERYQLNWPGKKEALLTANAPIAKTLRPCRDESVDFDTTENLFIEGDNLDALKLLQETYLGKVKMIYIDPPYNTGNDFIYNDDFSETIEQYLLESEQKDDEGNRLIANTNSNGRFHSDWLSMMYSRLKQARNLLSDEGFILASIDSNEVANFRLVMNEIFGADSHKNTIAVRRGIKNVQAQFEDVSSLSQGHEYVMLYSKNPQARLPKLLLSHGERKPGKWDTFWRGTDRPTMRYELFGNTPDRGQWRWEEERTKVAAINYDYFLKNLSEGMSIDDWYLDNLTATNIKLNFVRMNDDGVVQYYVPPSDGKLLSDNWMDITLSGRETTTFDTEKSVELLKRAIGWITAVDKKAVVLDFFAGSATTAHANMQLNAEDNGKRKFIMVQLPEPCDEKSEAYKNGYKTIADISKDRIRRAGKKIKEENPEVTGLDTGFRVLKIDSSNMNDVHYTPDSVNKDDLFNQVEHIKTDRSSEDLLFQVMLDWGVDLSLPIRKETIEDKEIYFVNDDDLVACFDKGIDEALIKALAVKQPLRVVFRDDGFVSDSVKINVEQIFKQLAPATDIKAI